MTNDQRRALEDAIGTYAVARVLHANSEFKNRPLSKKALERAWNDLHALLDELQEPSDG